MIKNFISRYKDKNAHISTKTIGVMGAGEGVGCSFIALSIAMQMKIRVPNVAIVNYRNKKKYDLASENINDLGIPVFSKEELREAFAGDFEVVVYDFGVLDREDNELLSEFERCYRKYLVTVPSIFKRNTVNNVIHYYSGYKNFTTVFNLTNEEIAPSIKKEIRSFAKIEDIIIFPPITDVMHIDEMQVFAKELLYEF